MVKYDNLQSANAYITYTLRNYIECYDDLEPDEIKKMTEVFDAMKNHTFTLGNKIIDNAAQYGVLLELTADKKTIRDTADVTQQMDSLKSSVDVDSKKELLFFQSVSHLIDAMQYVDANELMHLNDLFTGVNQHKNVLGDSIKESDTSFYPYNRKKANDMNKRSSK